LAELISYVFQDWRANRANQFSRAVMVTYRVGHLIGDSSMAQPVKTVLSLAHKVVSAFVLKIVNAGYIQPQAEIGPGLRLPHGLNGVFINRNARIGADCVIYQQVTLGDNFATGGWEAPTLGDRVVIGAGAKVVGPVFVGDQAMVGANSVVSKDVPAGTVAVGVPARILQLSKLDAERLVSPGSVAETAIPQG
jgi:serine O-acetyltransferase